jgi:hypothetical protein
MENGKGTKTDSNFLDQDSAWFAVNYTIPFLGDGQSFDPYPNGSVSNKHQEIKIQRSQDFWYMSIGIRWDKNITFPAAKSQTSIFHPKGWQLPVGPNDSLQGVWR